MDDKHPMGINWENVARHAMDIEIPAKNAEIADLKAMLDQASDDAMRFGKEAGDLREKCDNLAGQLLKVNAERTEPDKLYIITGRREFKEAVQIAREVVK